MIRSVLLSLIFSFLVFFSISSAARSEPYVVSGNPNSPPIVWEENQNLTGFAVDLAGSVLNLLQIPYTVKYSGNWQEVQKMTREGSIDMIVSAYKNESREGYLLFSDPFLSQPVVILVKKGNEFTFSSWDALIGKVGVSNLGESYGEQFDQFIKNKLDVSYHPMERAIELLARSEADYLIIDLYTAVVYTGLMQGNNAVTILDPAVTVQDFHFAINKNSELAARVPEINQKIAAKRKSKELQNLFLMHFDKWKQLIDQRNNYFTAGQEASSAEHQAYIKKQEAMARQRILRTMTDREGLPPSAN